MRVVERGRIFLEGGNYNELVAFHGIGKTNIEETKMVGMSQQKAIGRLFIYLFIYALRWIILCKRIIFSSALLFRLYHQTSALLLVGWSNIG